LKARKLAGNGLSVVDVLPSSFAAFFRSSALSFTHSAFFFEHSSPLPPPCTAPNTSKVVADRRLTKTDRMSRLFYSIAIYPTTLTAQYPSLIIPLSMAKFFYNWIVMTEKAYFLWY